MSQQLSILDAIERRDTGIKRAVDHADRVKHEWSLNAVSLLRVIVQAQSAPFLAEDLIAQVEIEPPPDKRAWGGVIQRLAKTGVIQKVGYAPAKSSNLSPKCLWAKVSA